MPRLMMAATGGITQAAADARYARKATAETITGDWDLTGAVRIFDASSHWGTLTLGDDDSVYLSQGIIEYDWDAGNLNLQNTYASRIQFLIESTVRGYVDANGIHTGSAGALYPGSGGIVPAAPSAGMAFGGTLYVTDGYRLALGTDKDWALFYNATEDYSAIDGPANYELYLGHGIAGDPAAIGTGQDHSNPALTFLDSTSTSYLQIGFDGASSPFLNAEDDIDIQIQGTSELNIASGEVAVLNNLVIPSGTSDPANTTVGGLFLRTDLGTNGALRVYANGAWQTAASF